MILCLGTTPTVQRTMEFDRVALDAVNRATRVTESASGKSINVARTLHTLGQYVLASGFLGGDGGNLIREDLNRSGIAHEFVNVTPKTRTCVTVIDHATGTATELVEETRPVESKAWDRLLETVDAHLWQAEVLVLSGSLPPESPRDFYARCTRMARVAGVPVVLDTRGEPLREALGEKPTVVKPNRLELKETVSINLDSDDDLRAAIRELIARGPKWAVITDGPRDAIASDGETFWRITPPPIRAINPIGSGDAFAAGIAIALLREEDLPNACRRGAACGAANALSSPAGHGRKEDVERLLNEIRVAAI